MPPGKTKAGRKNTKKKRRRKGLVHINSVEGDERRKGESNRKRDKK